MKKFATVALLIITSLFVPCAAHAVLIDFDDIAAGNPTIWTADRYLVSDGALFSTDAGTLFSWTDPSNGFFVATTGLNYVYGGASDIPSSPFEVSFWINGSPAVTSGVSFDVIDYAAETSASWSAEIFDSQNSLLSGSTGTGSGVTVAFNNPNIHRVRFTPSSDFEGFDTLNFNPLSAVNGATVPEPMTMTLFGVGFAGLLVRRKIK